MFWFNEIFWPNDLEKGLSGFFRNSHFWVEETFDVIMKETDQIELFLMGYVKTFSYFKKNPFWLKDWPIAKTGTLNQGIWHLIMHLNLTGSTTTSLEQLSKDYRYSGIGWCVSRDFGQWQREVARPCCPPSSGLKRGCDCLAGQSDKSFRCISKGNTTRSR